jgi:4-hydroxy-tetrahydrodipicolinate synthase
MNKFKPGLVHTPVTPFKRDQSVDYEIYAKLLEWHIRNGADALALPMPEGEDMSLKDEELRRVVEFAIGQVKGRVPVIAHVSDAGTTIAIERAKHAGQAGAAAIVSHPPYFWHTKPEMTVEHLVSIGSAVKLPFLVYQPPVESVGVTLTTKMTLQLIEKLPNFAGVVDAGMDWVYMVEAISNGRKIRPEFQLLPATDYMVSARVMGGVGAFSALSAVAPKLVRQVYDACQKEDYKGARPGQEDLAALRHLLKHPRLETGLKVALGAMGRECGVPRPPVRPLGEVERGRMTDALARMPALRSEPRGW